MITKEKIRCLKQTKIERQISLHMMAGQDVKKWSAWKITPPQYNLRAAGLLEYDPRPKGAGKNAAKTK